MSLRLKLLYKAATLYWQLFKPVTLGVKALLIREDQVLLVQHSYKKGWYLPGGGVKKQESLETAVRRECDEEIGGTIDTLTLFGVYSQVSKKKNDHIVVMLGTGFTFQRTLDKEISAIQLFPLTQLPQGTTLGTRHRIEEYLSNQPVPYFGDW